MEKEPKKNIEAVLDTVGDFVDVRINLFKLQAISKTSEIVSSLAGSVVFAVFIIFFLSMLNIGLALLIGDWLGKAYFGFFILAAIYLLAGLILISQKDKWIKSPVANALIQKVFK